MDEAKLKEALSDEAFVKEPPELDTPEEVQDRLKEEDVDVSVEEIQQTAKSLQELAKVELYEDALEDVDGGLLFTIFMAVLGTIAAFGVAFTAGTVISGITGRWW